MTAKLKRIGVEHKIIWNKKTYFALQQSHFNIKNEKKHTNAVFIDDFGQLFLELQSTKKQQRGKNFLKISRQMPLWAKLFRYQWCPIR